MGLGEEYDFEEPPVMGPRGSGKLELYRPLSMIGPCIVLVHGRLGTDHVAPLGVTNTANNLGCNSNNGFVQVLGINSIFFFYGWGYTPTL